MVGTSVAERLTVVALARRVEESGPVTVLVPDFGDPSGMGKVPRAVAAVLSGGAPGGWTLFFAGEYLYPMMLRTSGGHEYEVSTAEPARGPVARVCPGAALAAWVGPLVPQDEATLRRQAYDVGFSRGERHAAYVEAYGEQGGVVPDVPAFYASVADAFADGWVAGVDHFSDESTAG